MEYALWAIWWIGVIAVIAAVPVAFWKRQLLVPVLALGAFLAVGSGSGLAMDGLAEVRGIIVASSIIALVLAVRLLVSIARTGAAEGN